MQMSAKIAGISLVVGLMLSACATTDNTTNERFQKVRVDFLDDVAEAEIADRMANSCAEFDFNPDENTRVIEKLSLRIALLEGRDGLTEKDVKELQRQAPGIMKNRESKKIIAFKIRENLQRLNLTPETVDQICKIAAQQYKKRTQIGRFLKRL